MVAPMAVMKVDLLVDLRADQMADEWVEWMGKLKAERTVVQMAA